MGKIGRVNASDAQKEDLTRLRQWRAAHKDPAQAFGINLAVFQGSVQADPGSFEERPEATLWQRYLSYTLLNRRNAIC